MESPLDGISQLGDASKRVAEQAFVICENRLQLFMLEVQEERDRIFRAFCLGLAVAVFVLLAGVALTVAITVIFLPSHPVAALLVLTAVYAGVAAFMYSQLMSLRRDWQSFSATFNELKKDRECLKRNLN